MTPSNRKAHQLVGLIWFVGSLLCIALAALAILHGSLLWIGSIIGFIVLLILSVLVSEAIDMIEYEASD